MAILTREEILAAKDTTIEKVAVAEWGGEVCIRGLSVDERDDFEARTIAAREPGTKDTRVRARLVALCACNEKGEKIFTEKDVAILGMKSAAALEQVFIRCMKLSRLRNVDIKELEGN